MITLPYAACALIAFIVGQLLIDENCDFSGTFFPYMYLSSQDNLRSPQQTTLLCSKTRGHINFEIRKDEIWRLNAGKCRFFSLLASLLMGLGKWTNPGRGGGDADIKVT